MEDLKDIAEATNVKEKLENDSKIADNYIDEFLNFYNDNYKYYTDLVNKRLKFENFVIKQEKQQKITTSKILEAIKEHRKLISRFEHLKNYYENKHNILYRWSVRSGRQTINNKIVCAEPEYITTIATGYLVGKPVVYKTKSDIDITQITNLYNKQTMRKTDMDLAKSLSKFGRAYDYVYTDSKTGLPKTKVLSVFNTFVVFSNDIEEESLYAVYYTKNSDDKYTVLVYTENKTITYIANSALSELTFKEEKQHYMERIPITEIKNKDEMTGDYEGVISLVDMLDLMVSDRANDIEQFIDSLLVLYGSSLGDTPQDVVKNSKLLRMLKTLEMPEGSRAEYLSKTLDQVGIQTVIDDVCNKINKYSLVPNITDEQFGNNTSGIAMEYKLFGLRTLASMKVPYLESALRRRMKMYNTILCKLGKMEEIDTSEVDVIFTDNLPRNDLEAAQIVATLNPTDTVSKKTLSSQLSFVTDTEAEQEQIEEENKKRALNEFNNQEKDLFNFGGGSIE